MNFNLSLSLTVNPPSFYVQELSFLWRFKDLQDSLNRERLGMSSNFSNMQC
jgi:hypothetical protein